MPGSDFFFHSGLGIGFEEITQGYFTLPLLARAIIQYVSLKGSGSNFSWFMEEDPRNPIQAGGQRVENLDYLIVMKELGNSG